MDEDEVVAQQPELASVTVTAMQAAGILAANDTFTTRPGARRRRRDVTGSRKATTPRDQAKTWVAELRSARLAGGFPRGQIADALGVGSATVRSWEDRRRIPILVNLIGFGRELGLRLVIVDQNGRVHPGGIAVRPGESWEEREIRRLAAALRSQRRDCALSQHAVALATDVSTASIAQFESGRLRPSPATLAAWAAALDCRVRWQALV